jgi:16S rRNA (adenine1518-N6/adenine1519-N6)-dimethyltransferase
MATPSFRPLDDPTAESLLIAMTELPGSPVYHVPDLLRRYGLRPDKRLGQNFLIDEVALLRVVDVAGIEAGDDVLEIGPGLGGLTRHLAGRARQVVAVELDGALLPALREVLAPHPNVRLVHGDILALDPAEWMTSPGYLVVANIPYYITSALIRHLLEARTRPRRLVLTVQREVAERITATPGAMSLLALSVQLYGQPQVVAHIPAGAFYPAPKVDSAVIRTDIYPAACIPESDIPAFFRLAKAGFSQKRKTLRNALSAGLACPPAQAEQLLQSAGIDPRRRAETLSIEEWGQLVTAYVGKGQVPPLNPPSPLRGKGSGDRGSDLFVKMP